MSASTPAPDARGVLDRLLAAGAVTPTQQLFLDTDWSATPLGSPTSWSTTLRAAVGTCLNSRFPMQLMAGPHLVMVYNDGYAGLLGIRHPMAMGRVMTEVWGDVWHVIGELVAGVWQRREPVYFEDFMLVTSRRGFDEETYFTFCYSPLLGPDGDVVALLNTAMETTPQVLAARRLALAQRLGQASVTRHADLDDACRQVTGILAQDRADLPVGALYLLADVDDPGSHLELRGRYGTREGEMVATPDDEETRALLTAALAGTAQTATGLAARWPGLAPAPADVGGGVVDTAVALPLVTPGRPHPVGVLVLGVSPHLVVDDAYRTFLELMADQVAAVLGDTLTSLAERASAAAARGLAEALQRSLLTDPVQPDHLEIAARYVPAAHESQIGGDWYDAFLCQDGSTWLVVGDVAGHDQDAAAVMAQVRNLLRGIAYTLQRSPADVLDAVDRAMAGLGVSALISVVAMRIEQGEADAALGRQRIRWCNAGHPAPVLVGADGGTRLLDTPAQLLLGVQPYTERTDHEVVLDEGGAVLLYTDGLVERRGVDLDEGSAWLVDVVRRRAGAPIEELCDRLIAAVAGHADDDVALMAVRAHPQARPRPAAAGPNRVPADAPPVA